MQDVIQPLSLGQQTQGKKSLPKLTDQQKKLITENLNDIKRIITKKYYIIAKRHKVDIDQLLSFLPEAILSFDESRGMRFVTYAVDKCYRLFLDSVRGVDLYSSLKNKGNTKKVTKDVQHRNYLPLSIASKKNDFEIIDNKDWIEYLKTKTIETFKNDVIKRDVIIEHIIPSLINEEKATLQQIANKHHVSGFCVFDSLWEDSTIDFLKNRYEEIS